MTTNVTRRVIRRAGDVKRRKFLSSVAGIIAMPFFSTRAAETEHSSAVASNALGRRKLGGMEVSAVGLGVQNMTRRYETTVPDRAEMIDIIRAAFDRGVTSYDAAEAYGPH